MRNKTGCERGFTTRQQSDRVSPTLHDDGERLTNGVYRLQGVTPPQTHSMGQTRNDKDKRRSPFEKKV